MPVNFTQRQRRSLLLNLSRGRVNAITAPQLARVLNYPTGGNQVQLRSLIKECIEHDGDLIGAVTGRPAGFFIINTLQELETYADSLERRTRSDNQRRSALINNWNNAHNRANTARPILTLI